MFLKIFPRDQKSIAFKNLDSFFFRLVPVYLNINLDIENEVERQLESTVSKKKDEDEVFEKR